MHVSGPEDTGTAERLTVFVVGEQAMLASTAESQRTWKMMRFRHEFPDLSPDVSIGQIKEMLGMLVGIAPQHQELCLRGVKCRNSQTLEVMTMGFYYFILYDLVICGCSVETSVYGFIWFYALFI